MRHISWFALAVLLLIGGSAKAQIALGPGWWKSAPPPTAFVGDLDTAGTGILGYWGIEAASSALRGPTHAVIRVCLPSGGSCFDVGTDATTGEITAATVAFNGSGALSACNNTTTICVLGSTSGDVEFYDQSGNGHNIPGAAGHALPTFVVAGGCPSPILSTIYCVQSTSTVLASTTGSVASTCPCGVMSMAIDTLGNVHQMSLTGGDGGNWTLYSDNGTLDFFNNGTNNNILSSDTNNLYDVIAGSGPSGYATANSTSISVTGVQSNFTNQLSLMSVPGSPALTGYIIKGAIWNAVSSALAVSSGNAATMISNSCTRITGSSAC